MRAASQLGTSCPSISAEAFVLAQTLEILDAIAAERVQNQETLHIPGFIQAAVPLFDFQMLLHAARHIQGASSLQKQRNAGIGRDAFFQGLWIELKQKLTCGETDGPEPQSIRT